MAEYSRCVFVASGHIEAQQVPAFLEAEGVNGPGRVEIMAAEADVERARALLAAAEAGDLRLDDGADV